MQHGSLGQHFRTSSSPEGAARLTWATLSYIFVARGCSTARLSDTFVHLRRPRVQHGSLGQHFRTLSSPEGAARRPWATLSYIFVAQGCSTALLGNTFVHLRRPRVQHGSLGQHFRTISPPEGAARLPWATLSYYIAAQGCSTARLSDTSARFRRPKVLGKRRKVESDKKKKKSPKKTRETSVGCPKPGSNRHVFKGHWILSPTRLPIPPFGHIQAVDFPLETSHFRCTSASNDCKVIEFPPIFQNIQQKAYAKKRVIPLVRQKALIPDK